MRERAITYNRSRREWDESGGIMDSVITEADKAYEAEERKNAPGPDQPMADRVNNRSLRPNS